MNCWIRTLYCLFTLLLFLPADAQDCTLYATQKQAPLIPNSNERIAFALPAPGNGFYIGYDRNHVLRIARLKANGDVLWAKDFAGLQQRLLGDSCQQAIINQKQEIVAVHYNGLILRVDSNGQLLQQVQIKRPPNSAYALFEIVQSTDGSYLFLFKDNGYPAPFSENHLVRLAEDLNTVLASRFLNAGPGVVGLRYQKMVATNEHVFLIGRISFGSPTQYASHVALLRLQTLETVRTSLMTVASGTNYSPGNTVGGVAFNGGALLQVYTGLSQPIAQSFNELVHLDSNLQVTFNRQLFAGSNNLAYATLIAQSQGVYVVTGGKSEHDFFLDLQFNLQYVRSSTSSEVPNKRAAVSGTQRLVLFGGYRTTGYVAPSVVPNPIGFTITDATESHPVANALQCSAGPNELSWAPGHLQTSQGPAVPFINQPGGDFLAPANTTVVPASINFATLCQRQQACTKPVLQGATIPCGQLKTTIKTQGQANCWAALQWQQLSGPAGQLSQFGADSVVFAAPAAGNYQIVASVPSGCGWLRDTINLTFSSTQTPALRADTSLCSGDSLTLSPGTGFTQYLWSTGAQSPSITVKQAGSYWVQTRSYCGGVERDTIVVGMHALQQIVASTTVWFCPGDSAVLPVNTAVQQLTWQPAGVAVLRQDSLVVTGSSVLRLEGKDAFACTTKDSVEAILNPALSINFGKDTALCAVDSLVLQLPPNAGFHWSDGYPQLRRVLRQPGLFWASVISSAGCRSADSLLLTQLPTPAPQLGYDTSLCIGDTLRLMAGSGPGNQFLWSDGSTDSSLAVTAKGLYWVRATNTGGCVGSDSFQVVSILAKPYRFLGRDTIICPGYQLALRSRRPLKNWVWDDGSRAEQRTVDRPGIYTLEAADGNGCRGKDTIAIKAGQACDEVVLFPTAFTPNNDGLNDVFRPFVRGPISEFELLIFNRNGQLVFHTKASGTGWDGLFKGVPQPAGTYVFTARYRFASREWQSSKGTVVLMR